MHPCQVYKIVHARKEEGGGRWTFVNHCQRGSAREGSHVLEGLVVASAGVSNRGGGILLRGRGLVRASAAHCAHDTIDGVVCDGAASADSHT
eukprot:343410-Pyramimonas_sp.AAC.2